MLLAHSALPTTHRPSSSAAQRQAPSYSAQTAARAPQHRAAAHSSGALEKVPLLTPAPLSSSSLRFFSLFLSFSPRHPSPPARRELRALVGPSLHLCFPAFLDSPIASAPQQHFRFAIIFRGFCFLSLSPSLSCTSSRASLRATSSPTSRTGNFPSHPIIKPSLRTRLCRLVGIQNHTASDPCHFSCCFVSPFFQCLACRLPLFSYLGANLSGSLSCFGLAPDFAGGGVATALQHAPRPTPLLTISSPIQHFRSFSFSLQTFIHHNTTLSSFICITFITAVCY
ncbi:hypothetical protein HDV63DRAFT_347474 [Trichoderma sp. SZMC 28014]